MMFNRIRTKIKRLIVADALWLVNQGLKNRHLNGAVVKPVKKSKQSTFPKKAKQKTFTLPFVQLLNFGRMSKTAF